jgi:anaerobic selenocysteine-containing dehydrogenase
MQVNRRQFFKLCAGGMAGSTIATLGLLPETAMADVRSYKLMRASETRNTCPYCSVGCGILMYGLGDGAKTPSPKFSISRATRTIRSTVVHSVPRAQAWWISSTAPTA